jgi:polysaccharide export outer membrane protein
MKIRFILLLFCALSLLAACHSSQELAYFSDAERDSVQAVLSTYNTTIHPGDQLYIYVYSQAPEIAVPFNQETHSIAAEITHLNSVGGTNRSNKMSETFQQSNFSQIPGYLVDEAGTIVFPILGKMVVAGLTQDSLSRRIQNMLIDGGYINDPVVTVTPMNFRVTVIGEVAKPQELHITGDRLTILEALAMCGDLTMDGKRENVTVMREKNGVATPINIDLTKKTLFDSEVYYLQSNDVVYVEPSELKKRRMHRDENWPKYVTSTVSIVVTLRNIYRTWFVRAPKYL